MCVVTPSTIRHKAVYVWCWKRPMGLCGGKAELPVQAAGSVWMWRWESCHLKSMRMWGWSLWWRGWVPEDCSCPMQAIDDAHTPLLHFHAIFHPLAAVRSLYKHMPLSERLGSINKSFLVPYRRPLSLLPIQLFRQRFKGYLSCVEVNKTWSINSGNYNYLYCLCELGLNGHTFYEWCKNCFDMVHL